MILSVQIKQPLLRSILSQVRCLSKLRLGSWPRCFSHKFHALGPYCHGLESCNCTQTFLSTRFTALITFLVRQFTEKTLNLPLHNHPHPHSNAPAAAILPTTISCSDVTRSIGKKHDWNVSYAIGASRDCAKFFAHKSNFATQIYFFSHTYSLINTNTKVLCIGKGSIL